MKVRKVFSPLLPSKLRQRNNRLKAHVSLKGHKGIKHFIHSNVFIPHLFSPLVDCFNAKLRCRNTTCNEWTTRLFFHLTLSFNPPAIITCFTNLASLFHCFSKPIAQMFCTVISRNESWCISVPAAVQIGPVLGVKRRKKSFFLLLMSAPVRSEPRVGAEARNV